MYARGVNALLAEKRKREASKGEGGEELRYFPQKRRGGLRRSLDKKTSYPGKKGVGKKGDRKNCCFGWGGGGKGGKKMNIFCKEGKSLNSKLLGGGGVTG